MKIVLLVLGFLILNACANRYQNTAIGMTAAGLMPINEIEQTYYLGIFDPKEQIPPQVYRIRVHGQSSMGGGKFASGWVPADLIDTLNLEENTENTLNYQNTSQSSPLKGRKLMTFGPDGFRKVPQNHRLVMVMGSNANEFFNAASEALGNISKTKSSQNKVFLNAELFKALQDVTLEKQRLLDLMDDLSGDTL